jgi:hypothetical protein
MAIVLEFPGSTKESSAQPISPLGAAFDTREGWLQSAVENLRLDLLEKEIRLPEKIRVAPGWPLNTGGARGQSRVVAQCWASQASRDGRSEIFIAPTLDDGLSVTEALCHELIHSADDCKHGHRGPFRQMALAIGLEGPMRSTRAGPALRERLNALCSELGPYPHAALDPTQVVRKQSTRLIKVVCYSDPDHCYAFWTTRVHLDVGTPTCVCGGRMVEVTRR